MRAKQQKTRVVLDGIEISRSVMSCTLPRYPEQVNVVDLRLLAAGLEADPDGTLVIHINTQEK